MCANGVDLIIGKKKMTGETMEHIVQWSDQKNSEESGRFAKLAKRQSPPFFKIGRSDSRLANNVGGGVDPGEAFLHRNAADLNLSSEMNLLSALEFAVNARVHGLFFGLKNGRHRDLDCTIGMGHFRQEVAL